MTAVLLIVTALSLVVAAVASTIAWRVTREEQRRSAARVDALSQAIYEDEQPRPSASSTLFEESPPASRNRHQVAAAIGVCVMVTIAGLTFLAARPAKRATIVPATAAKAEAPLELIALEQDREDGRLIVRGLVRTPANGASRDGLTAVVALYSRSGDLLASGLAAVPVAALAGGGTAPFVVNMPDAGGEVDRFRLSFRTNGRVEPHVDRRARSMTSAQGLVQ